MSANYASAFEHQTPEFPLEPTLLIATFSLEGVCYEANPAWEALFGRMGGPWHQLIDEDRTHFQELLKQAAQGQQVLHELMMLHFPERDEPVPALFNIIPVHLPPPQAKAPVALVVTVELLVEPRSLTYTQSQRHRLETLGRMALGIAHDFNNLLMSILGNLELLRFSLGEGTAEVAGYLQALERAALDGAALMRKLQEYVRQEKPAPFAPVDLPTLLDECLMLTRPYWYNEPRRQGLTICLETDLQPVPPIRGLASELRQVFTNLILNAVQAMPQGGVLRVETGLDPERGVRVRLSDTGIGMTEAVRKRIFEPLFTTKPEGSGMGLAIAAGIVREHGGSIEVDSTPGIGTTFTLYFPPIATSSTTESATTITRAARPVHVLIVDDEPGVRTILARLLSLKGHTVTQAASATEALSLLQTQSFDIVFTDQGMPEISGLELSRHIRAQFPQLPIVLISGDTELDLSAGSVDAVLAKPFRLQDAENLIRKLCGSDPSK